MVKKLYRATREEYKHRIKEDLEKTITTFNEKLEDARTELETLHEATIKAAKAKDDANRETFKTTWVDAQLVKFDQYDEETSPITVHKLEVFRD